MKAFACIAVLLFPLPLLAADAQPAQRPSAQPDKPIYSVWAFKLTNGQWVKDESRSWTTSDPQQGLAYAQSINAVPGWCATTNCPGLLPPPQRYVARGRSYGGRSYGHRDYGGLSYVNHPDGATISIGGWTVYLPHTNLPMGSSTDQGGDSGSFDYTPSYDTTPPYDNTSDIQNMLNTQDMLNTQMMNNNIQDMINTQNMVNTQNMIDTQNAINAMNQ